VKIPKVVFAFVSVALLFVSAAIAGENNKATVRISQNVTVDGKPLDPGKYTAQWTGEGPNVQVTLTRGKDTVATFAAQIRQETSRNSTNAIGTSEGPNGTKQLTSIYPDGKEFSIQIGDSSAAPSSSSSR
jgi:UDP-N-acetylmuramyl tripeptide synthase